MMKDMRMLKVFIGQFACQSHILLPTLIGKTQRYWILPSLEVATHSQAIGLHVSRFPGLSDGESQCTVSEILDILRGAFIIGSDKHTKIPEVISLPLKSRVFII